MLEFKLILIEQYNKRQHPYNHRKESNMTSDIFLCDTT